MKNTIECARNEMLEWWFIFSQTGDIYDCMALMDSMNNLDNLLANDYEAEL